MKRNWLALLLTTNQWYMRHTSGETAARHTHADFPRNSHQTVLYFEEPLLPAAQAHSGKPFRRFASVTIPGYASELAFFRQTIAVVTEKAFVIAEPGNNTTNSIPTFPASVSQSSSVVRMVTGAKPMAMYQIAENEFLLVYNWGACFVTKCQ